MYQCKKISGSTRLGAKPFLAAPACREISSATMHSHTLNLESFLTLKLDPTSIIPLQHKNEPRYYKCFYTSTVLFTLQEHTSIVDKVVQLWNVDKN